MRYQGIRDEAVSPGLRKALFHSLAFLQRRKEELLQSPSAFHAVPPKGPGLASSHAALRDTVQSPKEIRRGSMAAGHTGVCVDPTLDTGLRFRGTCFLPVFRRGRPVLEFLNLFSLPLHC